MTQRRPGQFRSILAVICVLFLAGLGAWYLTRSDGTQRVQRMRPPTTVGVAEATLADMPVTVSAIGTVQPIVTATVRTQLAGTLFSIDFTEGQMVTKGEALAQIDPRPYKLALSQAEANLERDTAQHDQAVSDLARYRKLLAQDSIARQQVDAQAALVDQYAGTVAADRAAVATAMLNLDYTKITAPVSGRIGLRQADIGNYLTPADATGIAVITQLHPIDVVFALPQTDLPAIRERLAQGAELPVTVHDQSDTRVLAEGRFLTLDNQIDPTSGTVKAKARFDNPDGSLFPNQFVNVTVLVDTLHQAVTLPVSSIRHGIEGDFVFLLQPDQTVKLAKVTTGPSDGERIVIAQGVSAGQTAITEGADSLDDGSRVTLPGAAPRGGTGGTAGDKISGKTGDKTGNKTGGKPDRKTGGKSGGKSDWKIGSDASATTPSATNASATSPSATDPSTTSPSVTTPSASNGGASK